MQDFCIHGPDEFAIIAALAAAGLTVADLDGTAHPLGDYSYAGRIVETPGQYGPDFAVITPPVMRPGVYAVYRATDEQAAALLAVSLPEGVALVDPPAGLQKFGGEWLSGTDLAEMIASTAAAIQAEKCRVRDAGFLVDGIRFDSDQAARTSYLELADMLAADASYSTPWKASPGAWVTMNATLYAKVKAAGAAHIATCFAWQAARDAELATILAAVAAGTLSAREARIAVDAVSTICSEVTS